MKGLLKFGVDNRARHIHIVNQKPNQTEVLVSFLFSVLVLAVEKFGSRLQVWFQAPIESMNRQNQTTSLLKKYVFDSYPLK